MMTNPTKDNDPVAFRPVLYLLDGCPFSFKALLFVAEKGIADDFERVTFASGSDAEASVKALLARHFDKISFPTAQVAPGQFISDSDAIIERYSNGTDPATLPAFSFYADTVLPGIEALWKENHALKAEQKDDDGNS